MGHVRLDRVRLAIGGRTLLEEIDFEAAPGEFVAIVGPNGVGKTTLLRAMAGYLPVAAGSASYESVDVRALDQQARARSIALIGDDVETPHGMSVREVVLTGRFAHRAWWDWVTGDADLLATEAALARVALSALADRAFDTLSSGERQRAWLGLPPAQDARTLLLDEPTSHLDARYALEILALLRELANDGRAIVAVLHDLNEAAAFADRIAVLGERQLLACDVPQVALEPALLERAFGVAFERFTIDGGTRVLARGPNALVKGI